MHPTVRFSARTIKRLFSIAALLGLSGILLCVPLSSISVAQDSSKIDIGLTTTESNWLAAHQEIRLAVDINWAPFEFINPQKQYRGMAADYIRIVEKRLGITFNVDKERSWLEMIEAVKKHDLDAFSLVVKTPQREEYVNFTTPYISFPMVIVSLDDEPYIDGVEALRNKTIAVVKSYASHDLLAKNHPDLNLQPLESVRQGLEAVSYSRAFAFIGNLAAINQVIREAGITNLKISGQTPYRFELSMAVRKDWPELIPILQKALDSISPTERDQIYNRWIHLKFQEEVDYRYIVAIIFIGLMIVSIVLIWNRKLRREIGHRLIAENKLLMSEQRFRDFAETASDWLWEMDENLKYTYMSRHYSEAFNLDKETYIGKTRREVSAEHVDTEHWQIHLETLENHLSFDNFEYLLQLPDQDTRYISVSGRAIFDQQGGFLGYRGTGSDITERKKFERLNERLFHAIEHVPVGVALFDEEDRLIFFNSQYTEIMGIMADIMVIGETFENMLQTMVARKPVKQAVGREQEYIRERLEKRRKPGAPVEIHRIDKELLAYETHTPDGCILNIITDITEQKRVEGLLIEAKNEAEKANMAKSEFLASMSHDLRTPLNAIMGFSDLMRANTFGPLGNENYVQYANDIHNSGALLISLINDILDLSKIEAGKYDLVEEPLNVLTLIDTSIRQLESMAKAANLVLSIDIPPNFPSLQGDERALIQIFNNLISNAIKFSPQGGEIHISVTLEAEKQIVVSVTDTGIGMSANGIFKATQPFEQVNANQTQRHEGTGLGVYLCIKFMNLFGGSLKIESEIDKGTTVILRFPDERTIHQT